MCAQTGFGRHRCQYFFDTMKCYNLIHGQIRESLVFTTWVYLTVQYKESQNYYIKYIRTLYWWTMILEDWVYNRFTRRYFNSDYWRKWQKNKIAHHINRVSMNQIPRDCMYRWTISSLHKAEDYYSMKENQVNNQFSLEMSRDRRLNVSSDALLLIVLKVETVYLSVLS